MKRESLARRKSGQKNNSRSLR